MDIMITKLIEIRNEITAIKDHRPNVVFWIWVIGFLFTIGFYPEILSSNDFLKGLVDMVLTFCLWPLVLGAHVRTLTLGS